MKRFIPMMMLLASVAAHAAGSKTLVAYFSATGTTRAVAQEIARITGADIYEIEPQRPYAANPYDDSQLIQNEAYNDLRPAVANLPSAETIDAYDTIYVGTPLWWHQPAMVVCTFLEAYDLSGKVIVPFVTYGATTYLNEAMQKMFKCTPNSVHVPAELPEDIDPDNIREPQNDDAGIDVPQRPSQVEAWLQRMGLLNNGADGIAATGADRSRNAVESIPNGIRIIPVSLSSVSVHDYTGRLAYTAILSEETQVELAGGFYIVSFRTENSSETVKVTVA